MLYRLYFMDPRSGHIIRFAEYQAPDDQAAIGLAQEQEGANPLEIWSGHRKVGRIEAADPASRLVERWRRAREAQAQPLPSQASG